MRTQTSSAVRVGAFVSVAVALFCIQVDFFALNLAIPGISADLNVTASAAQWTLSAYMLALGCFFIVGGRLGDVFGRRRVLLTGLALFAAASVGCALAPGLGALVAARIVQGVGAALIFPVSVSVITNVFPQESRARALGAVFGVANIGTALGPFVGGGFTEGPGWRWIFWLLAPLSALSLLVAALFVPDSRDDSAPRQIDLVGCLSIVCCLAALTLAVERGSAWGWDSARTLALFGAAAAMGALFLVRERRASHPLVDLRLFRNVPFDLVTGMGAVSDMGYAVTIFVATLYLQGVRGLSALSAGTVFLAPALVVALTGPLGAWLAPRMRPTAVMALAGAVAGTGMITLSLVSAWWLFIPVFAWCGLGLGLGWTFASVATQQVVRPARAGEASGVVLTILVTMGAVALAAAASAITSLTPERSAEQAYDVILRVGGAVILLTAVAVMVVRHRLVVRGKVPPLSMRAPEMPRSGG
ncbi:MFS transporter [Kitasatospora atroaurantiaca]|uniref:EmrB/QacA subfamily drug resistance transporter n=1 Tax=Kitasatospora atroaurantiaca TaxID=285545 RepID=A0A561EIZ8_9ACTN|nr:MFS transporter [Kitasatospora atroaurantiaca]TWE15586.1 EmrB/QacA subfamily drug resistance transporter [Kitasatospora atroaurantiaca]